MMDAERNALRQLLKERYPNVPFRHDDINKLANAGYSTSTTLAASIERRLDDVLSRRLGVVAELLKAFRKPAGML